MLAAMIIIFYYAIYPANGTVDSTVFCLVVYYKMKGNIQNKKNRFSSVFSLFQAAIDAAPEHLALQISMFTKTSYGFLTCSKSTIYALYFD